MNFSKEYRRIISFARNYIWLIKLSFRKNLLKLWSIILLDIAGVAARVGAIALLAYFLHAMEGKGVIVIPYVNMEFSLGSGALALLSGTVFLLLSCGAWATYSSVHQTRRLGRLIHTFLAVRMFEHFQTIRCADAMSTGLDKPKTRAIKQIMRNSLQMGLAVENIVRSVQPMMYVLMGIGVAFTLEPIITLMISPMALLLLPAIYLVSSHINKSAKSFYHNDVQQYGREVSKQISELDLTSFIAFAKSRCLRFYEHNEDALTYLDSFDRNQLANDKMVVVTSVFQALSFSAAISIFGYVSLTGSRSWGEMLAYVMAIYYVINNVQGLTAYLSNLTRFYPQLIDYMDVDAMSHQINGRHNQREEQPLSGFQLVSTEAIDGGNSTISVTQGSVIWMHSSTPLRRFGYSDFVLPLINATALPDQYWKNADFITTAFQNPPHVSLLDVWLAGNAEKLEDLTSIIHEFGLELEISSLPNGIETILDDIQWKKLSGAFKSMIRLMPVLFSEESIVFVYHTLLAPLSDKVRELFFEKLCSKAIFVVINNAVPKYQIPADKVIVIQNNELAGIGNAAWFETVRDAINIKAANGNFTGVDDESLYDL